MSCSCARPQLSDVPEYADLASQGNNRQHLRVIRCEQCGEVHSESRQSHSYSRELQGYCICGAEPKK